MEKKKLFIIFTTSIHTIGGAQLYTSGKADYLKKNGWEVQCYSQAYAPAYVKALIPSMNEYVQKGNGELTFLQLPPYKFRKSEQNIFLRLLIDKIGIYKPQEYEIIIESHDVSTNLWAELIAEKLKALHIVILLHEIYSQSYKENLDFFYFKCQRNELVCGEKSCKALFNGYKNITAPLYDIPPTVVEQEPIQDVYFPIDKIQKLDWNICHIGRMVKEYIPYVIEGVAELARRHPDKKINFMFVGDVTPRRDFIMSTFKNIDNVQLTALGDMVPIPRILFSKVDVVCAISQSARFAANQGVLTIVANAKNPEKTPGVLGYDTKEQVYGEGKFSYVEALENVLVKHLYDGQTYSLPKLKPAEEYYKNFWTIVQNAAPEKKYYVQRLSQERIRDWTAIFPFGTISKGARLILFGATEIAKDYKKQIQSQQNSQIEFGCGYIKKFYNTPPHYEIVATVDEHPENFDNAVEGVERLKQKDYDVIVITAYPQQAQAAANKIVQIVPEMANRIIYNFNILQT